MPQYSAPDVFPDWAESSNALVAQPTPAQQASGFVLGQRPAAQTVNWLYRQVGRSIRWLSQGVNAVMTGASAEPSYRLIGGGLWSWNATTGVLAWADPFAISMPGLADSANVAAAGSVTLSAGQIAYVQSNAPFTTTGNLTSGSAQVTNLAYESGVSVGETVSGTGVPSGATVVAVSQSDSSITISAPATSSGSGVTLVFATSGALTVQAATLQSFSPSPNTVVVARCYASNGPNQVHVGVNAGQMRLLDGESKALLGNGYVATLRATAGAALTARQAVYLSPGAADGRTAGAVYPLDVSAGSTAFRSSFVGLATSNTASGAIAEIVTSGRVPGFSSLTPGTTYYANPTTPTALQTAKPSLSGQYVVPVGVASSADTLILASVPPSPVLANGATQSFSGAISAPSVISGAGFKSHLRAGYWYASNDNATERRCFDAFYNATAQSFDYVNVNVYPGVAGSFLGFSLQGAWTGGVLIRLYKNGTSVFTGNISQQPGSFIFANKGDVPFSATDALYVTVQQTNSGSLFRVQANIIVELGA